jgi:hypothetical protein
MPKTQPKHFRNTNESFQPEHDWAGIYPTEELSDAYVEPATHAVASEAQETPSMEGLIDLLRHLDRNPEDINLL